MSEENLVSPDSLIAARATVETTENIVEDIMYTTHMIEQELEMQYIAEEEMAKIIQTATEQGRIGTQIQLDIRDPSFQRMIGTHIGVYGAEESRELYAEIIEPSVLEEKLMEGYQLTPLQQIQQELQRTEAEKELEPEHIVEDLEIPEIALRLVDFQVMCALEAELSSLYPEQFHQVIQQLVEACQAKLSKIKPIIGYEALQKHMLQIYVPYFSTYPYSLNILAMRLTAATVAALQHKAVTLYETGAMSVEMLKAKYAIGLCENRTNETKFVASGKPLGEAVPSKFSISATEDLDIDDEVPICKDHSGHPLFWMTLRYAYSMPYYIRKMLAIQTGMPENYKFGLYFGIGGLPSRYSTWKQKWLHTPEAKYLNFSRDKTIMDLIQKYNSKRGFFYAKYGKYYKKRRV